MSVIDISDGRVEWIYLTRNNIIPNFNVDGYDLVIPKYPIGVNEFGKQEEYNQVVRHNLMPDGDGSLIVTNFQHMSEPDPIESFRYIPNKDFPESGRWVSNWTGGTNQRAKNTFIHIKSLNDLIESFSVPYQVAAPSSFQAVNERESRSPDKDTGPRPRSRSGSPPRQWDRSGKERGCKGTGCVVMGGKKKTRRHKSKKQKKSKSKFKRHKKSKRHKNSKRHTRGRK